MRRTRLIPTLVVLAASVTACGGEQGPTAVDGVTVLVAEPQDSGMEALMPGGLRDVGGCLGVGDAVVVFASGTEVLDGSPLRVDLPGVGERGLGDQVELGGGYVFEPTSGGPTGPTEVAGAAIPESCRDRPVFLASDS